MKWNTEKEEMLKELYKNHTIKECATILDTTFYSASCKIRELGLWKQVRNKDEENELYEDYITNDLSIKEMCDKYKLTKNSIVGKLRKYGIRKTKPRLIKNRYK